MVSDIVMSTTNELIMMTSASKYVNQTLGVALRIGCTCARFIRISVHVIYKCLHCTLF